jgi:serine/threonine protein kinase/tetratricopeptide (TPR) repeat protein
MSNRNSNNKPGSEKRPGIRKTTSFKPGMLLLKKYKIIKEIGSGGMGTVFLAEDINLGRKAAIKTLSENIYKEKDLRERFHREARALSKVEHPNICTIYEIFEEKDRTFIAMQYIEGKGLDEIQNASLTIQQKIEIVYQVALGLKQAHSSEIIHRDIKPSNIRIDARGIVKILDFGLAKRFDSNSKIALSPSAETIPIDDFQGRSRAAQTKEGTILGTVYYMSPEQARGEKLDHRSDIFSLGTVLYELVAGRLPYPVTDTVSALFHIVNTQPAKIEKSPKIMPKSLSRIISKSLEKNPAKRYQSLDPMISDLEKLRSEIGISYSSKISEELKKIATKKISAASRKKISSKLTKTPMSPATTSNRRLGSKVIRFSLGFLIILILFSAILYISGLHRQLSGLFVSQKKIQPSIVVVNQFKTSALSSEITDIVQFLLIRYLSQLPGVWFIDDTKFGEILDKHSLHSELGPKAYQILKTSEGLTAIVNGTIEKFGSRGMIEISPRILNIEESQGVIQVKNIRLDITPIAGQEDILLRLVDEISAEIIDKLDFKGAGKTKGIAKITTDDWQALLLYMQAEKTWALRKIEETADLLKKALKNDNEFLLAYGLLAEVEKFKGNNNTALKHLKTALSNPAKLTYADRLYYQSLEAELELDYQSQMDFLKKLSAFRPLDWNTSYALGEAYFHRGKISEAREIYEGTLKLSPKFAQALNHLGYCLSYLGENDKAIEILKEYKTLDETYNAYDSLGDGYFYAGDYDRAELYKIAALQKNPNVDWIYRSLGDIYLTVGRIKSALAMNDQFNRIAKGDKRGLAEAALQRAYIYLLTNKRLEAREQIDLAKTLYMKQEIFNFLDDMQWISGLWYLEGGQIEKAREELRWLEEIVNRYKVGPERYFTFYKYYLHLKALCDYYEGKTADARETMNKLISLGPKLGYWITYHHLSYYLVEAARMEYEMKSYDTAEQYINQALKYIPNYPYGLYYKAKITKALGDGKKAAEIMKTFLGICKGADDDYPLIFEAKRSLGK